METPVTKLGPTDLATLKPRLLARAQTLHSELGLSPHADLSPMSLVEEVLEAAERWGTVCAAGNSRELEAWLLARLESHVRERWNDRVSHYCDMLMGFGRLRWRIWELPSSEVELADLISGAWAKAQTNRLQFEGASEGEFVNWLYRILEHHVQDVIRTLNAKKRGGGRRHESLDAAMQESSGRLGALLADVGQSTPSSSVRREEWWARALAEIQCLLSPQREYIVLWIQGLSPNEIAAELALSKEDIASLHLKSIRLLRKRMQSLKGGW
jgi:RNA polymerase sigma factor (sigma-70 family)